MPQSNRLFYFSHGAENVTRPPLVFIHGAGGTHLHWPPQVRRMVGQRILALDLPGHGKSGGVGSQNIADYASAYRNQATTPVEVAERVIEAIEASNSQSPALRAIIACNAEDIRTQARISAERIRTGKARSVLEQAILTIKSALREVNSPRLRWALKDAEAIAARMADCS